MSFMITVQNGLNSPSAYSQIARKWSGHISSSSNCPVYLRRNDVVIYSNVNASSVDTVEFSASNNAASNAVNEHCTNTTEIGANSLEFGSVEYSNSTFTEASEVVSDILFTSDDLDALSDRNADNELNEAKARVPNSDANLEIYPPPKSSQSSTKSESRNIVKTWKKNKDPPGIPVESTGSLDAFPSNAASARRMPSRSWKKGSDSGGVASSAQHWVNSPLTSTGAPANDLLSFDWLPEDNEFEYYQPRIGDDVLGVVVSANGTSAEMDIGARVLAKLIRREITPLDSFSTSPDSAAELAVILPYPEPDSLVGKTKIILEPEENSKSPHPLQGQPQLFSQLPATPPPPTGIEECEEGDLSGKPCLEVGSIFRVEVLGVGLKKGHLMVSLKRVAQRLAWQRVKQIQAEGEPIEIELTGFNSGGCVASIEGLRAFLPVSQIINPSAGVVPHPSSLVGTKVEVLIQECSPRNGRFIVSQISALNYNAKKRAKVGCLVECEVLKLWSYGAIVRIRGTMFRGLLHVSTISSHHVPTPGEVFEEGEFIRALVVSRENDKLLLSTKELESEPGLIMVDKERVWKEADEMAAVFRAEFADGIAGMEDPREDESPTRTHKEDSDADKPIANLEWFARSPESEGSF